MRLLVLGRGKTGKLVADTATERGHSVRTMTERENVNGSALTPTFLTTFDCVLDFTTPEVVLSNIRATLGAGAKMVVGTTGWYQHLDEVRALVERRSGALIYGSNFSFGTQMLFRLAPAFAQAFSGGTGYTLHIHETHHAEKKDAPSGTALHLQQVLAAAGARVEITSEREGDAVGIHTLEARGPHDRITLSHEAFSRAVFAEGAVHAAEWIVDKTGLYDYRDVFEQIA